MKRKPAFSEGAQTGMTPGPGLQDFNPFEMADTASAKFPGLDSDVSRYGKIPAASLAASSSDQDKPLGGAKRYPWERRTPDQLSIRSGRKGSHPGLYRSRISEAPSEMQWRRIQSRSEDYNRPNSEHSSPVSEMPPPRRPMMPWRRTTSSSNMSFIKLPKSLLSTLDQEFLDSPRIPHSPTRIDTSTSESSTLFPPEARKITTCPEKARRFFFEQRSSSAGKSLSDWTYSSDASFLERNANQNWYRVKLQGVDVDAETDYNIPEHLPTSPLCPRHPKHPSGGGECVSTTDGMWISLMMTATPKGDRLIHRRTTLEVAAV